MESVGKVYMVPTVRSHKRRFYDALVIAGYERHNEDIVNSSSRVVQGEIRRGRLITWHSELEEFLDNYKPN